MSRFFERLGEWFLARLQERTTYAGFAVLVASFGHALPPEAVDALTTVGTFVAGGLIFASEGGK